MWKLVIYIYVYNLFVCAELHLPHFPNQSSMCFSSSQFASSLATIPNFIIGKFCCFIPFLRLIISKSCSTQSIKDCKGQLVT